VQSASTCSSLTGRDPLAYAQRKIDVAAVASVMKAYFRELTVPLFPTDKYKAFIECTRREDLHSRLDAIRDTVNTLHPAVVVVMRFLFRFLHRSVTFGGPALLSEDQLRS